MAKSRLEHIRDERLSKAKALRELGINPYPAQAKKDRPNQEVVDQFGSLEGQTLSLTGRIMSWRDHGHLSFAELEDQSGSIQLYIRDEVLAATSKEDQTLGFADLKLLDIGDFVEATGEVTKTKSGEISLLVKQLKILTKTLRPLPNRRDMMSDQELIFRRRYVDLALNPERRAMFERKSKFWRAARQFFLDRGFIELETPILEQVTGGADARPFSTYHNALDQTLYMRISSELYQKRLIGGGFEKIFVLGPNFRNEGIDDEHLQEYYQLEYYQAYSDVTETIALTKELYKYLAQEVWGRTKFTYKGHTFDFADDWPEIDYVKVIKERFDIDVFEASFEDMYTIIKQHNPEITFEANRNRLVDNLWKIIRKEISGPASLVNAPKFISPLAKSYFDTPHITQRFQPIIAGSEVGNAYSELNDPVDQLERFLEQQNLRDAGDAEAQMLDIDFVEMLEYGMPPTSCIGFSERLFWMLEGVTAREGTLFPQMKHKLEPLTKQIYGLKDPKAKSQNKYLSLSADFSAKYSTACVGYAIIEGVTIEKTNPELEAEKSSFLQSLDGLTNEKLGEYPEIQSYRKMYKDMGIDWHSRRPSPEALLRRLATGKGVYNINTLVDAYNLIVMKHRVSVGAFDLSNVNFPTTLEIAKGEEQILLLGDQEPTVLKAGEVSYFDQQGPYNLDFNYRDAKRTMVTEATKDVWINVDGVYDISPELVEQVLTETIEIITKYCGGSVKEKGMLTVS